MVEEDGTATKEQTAEETAETQEEQTAGAAIRGSLTHEGEGETAAAKAGEETAEEREGTEEKPPTLTAEQIKEAASDPEVRAAILAGDDTRVLLDDLVRTALTTKETEAEETRITAERAATVQEALKKAEESEDYGDLGRLAAETLKRNEAQAALLPSVQASVFAEYDAALTDVYEEEFKALSEEDKKPLNRSLFDSDSDFLSAVLTTLKGKQESLIRASMGVAVKEADEAAANATAGAAARADGSAGLGGGSAEEGKSGDAVSIGALVRASMAESVDYEE